MMKSFLLDRGKQNRAVSLFVMDVPHTCHLLSIAQGPAQITVLNIRNAISVFFRKLLGTQENLYKMRITTDSCWNSKQTSLVKEKR